MATVYSGQANTGTSQALTMIPGSYIYTNYGSNFSAQGFRSIDISPGFTVIAVSFLGNQETFTGPVSKQDLILNDNQPTGLIYLINTGSSTTNLPQYAIFYPKQGEVGNPQYASIPSTTTTSSFGGYFNNGIRSLSLPAGTAATASTSTSYLKFYGPTKADLILNNEPASQVSVVTGSVAPNPPAGTILANTSNSSRGINYLLVVGIIIIIIVFILMILGSLLIFLMIGKSKTGSRWMPLIIIVMVFLGILLIFLGLVAVGIIIYRSAVKVTNNISSSLNPTKIF